MSRKSADDRKSQILAEALVLADRLGPDRLTTTDIAKAVGLTQPAIFRHFPTKQALWLAIAESIAARLDTAWAQALDTAKTPEDRVRALFLAQLSEIAASPALPMILFSRELNVENVELRAAFHSLLLRFQSHLVAALEAMRAQGVLRGDLAAGDAAQFLTSLIQGLAIRWTLAGRGFPLVQEGARLLAVQMTMMRG